MKTLNLLILITMLVASVVPSGFAGCEHCARQEEQRRQQAADDRRRQQQASSQRINAVGNTIRREDPRSDAGRIEAARQAERINTDRLNSQRIEAARQAQSVSTIGASAVDPVDDAFASNARFQVGPWNQIGRVRTTRSGRQLRSLDDVLLNAKQRQAAKAIHGQRLAGKWEEAWRNSSNAREKNELA